MSVRVSRQVCIQSATRCYIVIEDFNVQLHVSVTNIKTRMAENAAAILEDCDQEEMEKHIGELENVQSEEELEKRLGGKSKLNKVVTNWMKYIFNRDTSQKEFNAVWMTEEEYIKQADDSLKSAWDILHLPEWRLEKRGSTKGDLVESKFIDGIGKVYRFTGIVECPPKFLYLEFRDNLAKVPEWNPTLLKSELIKEIAPGVELTYQVTAGGGRGIVAPRDFVLLRRTAPLAADGQVITNDDEDPYCFITSGVSLEVPGFPPNKDFVRGHNKVGCWFMKPSKTSGLDSCEKTVFQWLICFEFNGKIPQFVLDIAFATVMLDYIGYIRKFAAQGKLNGAF